MDKQKWIIHIVSLFLTIVIMFFISRVIINNSAFITQQEKYLLSWNLMLLVLASFAAYLLYQREKRNRNSN